MMKFFIFFVIAFLRSSAYPVENEERNLSIKDQLTKTKTSSDFTISKWNLPSNATSIRADISDSEFSCENKTYGYYADVENDCQIFHVCLPVKYANGKLSLFRWSFICPEETVFSQDSFTCMRTEDMLIDCKDSPKFFDLNGNLGMPQEEQSDNEKNSGVNESSNKIYTDGNRAMNRIDIEITKTRSPVQVKNKFQNSQQLEGTRNTEKVVDIDTAKTRNPVQVNNKPQNSEQLKGTRNTEKVASTNNEAITNENKDKKELNNSKTFSEIGIISPLIDSGTKNLNISNNVEKQELFTKGESIKLHQIKANTLPTEDSLDQNVNKPSNYIIPSLSIDDVIDLVKDSLDTNSEEGIKHDNSKIIKINKTYEGTEPIDVQSKDSKIIPLEIRDQYNSLKSE
ncbi:hypothetical protein ACFFRR_005437 [Megaselia abdita]